ncbi:MAG: hypothetical protein FWH23_05545 [Bacteroidales bacterium]|nr:hypothetical protein [Bacteroidales bacterium]MCL2132902.1 hypothetical protein [Bacteroidales bacterium]
MKRFSLTGIAITHSRSPLLFEAAYHGKYAYGLMPAATAAAALRLYEEQGLSGMNVTTPFKETILPYIDDVDKYVQMTGATNIVQRRANRWVAYNSDVYGATGSLHDAGVSLGNAACLVLGWGGAARAAVSGLVEAGARITAANRTIDKIKAMNSSLPVEILPFDEALVQTKKYTVIVNALPPIPALAERIKIHSGQVVLEADYACGALRDITRNAGALYIDGKQWLLHQAIPAFRLFTGEEPDIPAMRLITNNE